MALLNRRIEALLSRSWCLISRLPLAICCPRQVRCRHRCPTAAAFASRCGCVPGTISFYIRALLKYARKPGTDIVFEPEWKEHDNVLVQYGGLPLSSMATRPILVNEEAVRGMVTSWIRATASHVTDARAQANQSARAAPGHRRASSLRPAGGPRAWIPSYPEAPLESKLLYEAVMARRRSLALRERARSRQ